MPPAFTKAEFDARLAKVRAAMAERELDALVIGDPNNHNWLTGYDASTPCGSAGRWTPAPPGSPPT
jgi:Xaa-Pro aminopeptidase